MTKMYNWELSWKKPRNGNFLRESKDKRGRVRVWLGKGHKWANSGGWQYKSRYLVLESGYNLEVGEEVHHINEDLTDDRLENFEIMISEEHARFHARKTVVGRFRGVDGRFVSILEFGPHREPGLDEEDFHQSSSTCTQEVPF